MTARILTGDCRAILPTLDVGSVHCCITSPPYFGLRSYLDNGHVDKHKELGSESSLDAYIAELVTVFRLVRRVLRDDGTCWLNLGDSYAAVGGVHQSGSYDGVVGRHMNGMRRQTGGLKPKDLMMVPARVALALQADGWWLRSDIIWHKPNPMPESVTDRPTSSHEHVFLLTKRPRYFYDAEAVKENALQPNGLAQLTAQHKRAVLQDLASSTLGTNQGESSRNLRNVWTIATQPFPLAHFATFPPPLVEPCIKAGTSEKGCCAACGDPWTRVTERSELKGEAIIQQTERPAASVRGVSPSSMLLTNGRTYRETETIGWQPGCTCNADVVPCTVLDPFAGAGTVALVADRLARNSILIELNEQYAAMARQRLIGDCPMFAEVLS